MVHAQDRSPQEVIDAVNAQGGFGFLAHPFEKGMPFSEKSVAYTWKDLSVSGYAGICIWNFTSRWKERIKTALHGVLCLLFKVRSLKPPSEETLSFWDRVSQQRKVVAVGGSDSHGTRFTWGPFRFRPLSYDQLLNSVTVHLLGEKPLSTNLREAKEQVYGALRAGRLYIAHENLKPAKGFRFHYRTEGGRTLIQGDEAPFEPGSFHVELPSRGEIRLIRNGEPAARMIGRGGHAGAPGAGVYRVEVYSKFPFFGWRPWIYSNPIFLR
jgi:hypothetical protein